MEDDFTELPPEGWEPDGDLDGFETEAGADPEAVSEATVDGFFQPGGTLSRSMPGWEDRPGQWEMASGVASAIERREHLVVEAGTGTGKTLAYLFPLVWSRSRGVISTGTKNLQDQLLRKDVPLLERVLGAELRVAVMKGRMNFLCLQKLEDQERRPSLDGVDALTEFSLIRDWARRTETGDRAELRDLPGESRVWRQLDARREACTGKECELFDRCFVTRMHQRAREADLIVVNHHLFFADLALGGDDFGAIIPSHKVVVFDEAHALESVASQFFGVSLSGAQVDDLARDAQAAAARGGWGSKALDRSLKGLQSAAARFFDLFADMETRSILAERAEFRKRHADRYGQFLTALQGLEARLALVVQRSEETEPLRKRAGSLRATLRGLMDDVSDDLVDAAHGQPVLTMLLEDRTGDFVHWLEKRAKSVILRATLIDVSAVLRETLFKRSGTAILTSATLAVGGTFDYVRGRLGMGRAAELIVSGSFDFRRQTLLYLPADMPDPKSQAFASRAADEIAELLRHSRGRAFVLCTSYRQMEALHKAVSPAIDYPCLMQGQGSHAGLLGTFRSTENCVLFATRSFWQGVDVQGDRLSLVIIDKIPFAVPTDPVVAARANQIQADGGNPFREYQIPAAVLSLKQGFGRLIRSVSDRGVLALLDSRIVTKSYGKTFLDSLPDYPRTDRLEDVAAFFRG